MKKILLLLPALLVGMLAWAQGSFGNIPQEVDYRDALITNVGVVAVDVYQWAVVDSMTHKVDTVYTAEPYILWESDGDLEQQAEARRAPRLPTAKPTGQRPTQAHRQPPLTHTSREAVLHQTTLNPTPWRRSPRNGNSNEQQRRGTNCTIARRAISE